MLAKTCTMLVAAVLALGSTVEAGCAANYGDCTGDGNTPLCCNDGYYCQPWSVGYYQCKENLPKCPEQRTNIEFSGDFLQEADASQPGECCDACARTPGCVAYTYNNGKDGKPGCTLKKGMTNPVKKAGVVSGILAGATPGPTDPTTPGPTSCPNIMEKTDLYGDDIQGAQFKGVALGDCCDKCKNEPKCVAWSYDSNKVCYLKSGKGTKQANNGVTSAYVDKTPSPPDSKCPNALTNTDFYGDDIQGAQFKGISLGDCCDKCKNEAKCVAWSYDGTCYLKSGKGTQQTKTGVTSGTFDSKTPTPPTPSGQCLAPMVGWDLYGDDLKKFSSDQGTVQASDCCTQCSKEAGCVAYTLADNICYLKRGLGQKQSKGSATSGILIPSACSNPLVDTDFYGDDLDNGKIGSTSLSNCCDQCNKNDKCAAYTYADGNCYLKKGQGNKQTKTGAISGVKLTSSRPAANKVYHFRVIGL